MSARKRLIASLVVLACTCLISVSCSIMILYNTSIRQQRERLVDIVTFEASIIEAMSEHETVDHSISHYETIASIVSQLAAAEKSHVGFGKTGEFILGRTADVEDDIEYVFRQRHQKQPVTDIEHISRSVDQAMHRALNGETGTITGLDYLGERVLSAFTYIPNVKMGLVAKIDLNEIQSPFVNAGVIASGILIFVVLGGVVLLYFINDPTIHSLEAEIEARIMFEKELGKSENRYRTLVDSIDHCISLIDEDHNVIMVNRKYSEIFLKETSEFVARKCYVEFENRDSACSDCPGIRSLSTGEQAEKEIEIVTPGMGRRFYRVQAFPLDDTINGKRMYIELVMDETDKMELQEKLLNNETRLRMLASKLIDTIEDERKRVSRDLHDSVGQLLTSIRLHAEWMLNGKSNADPGEELTEMIGTLEKGSDELHRLCRGLRPQLLDKVGLKEALEELVEETFEHHDIRVQRYINPVSSQELSPEVSITVYRVFQEAVNNIVKHSNASSARLSLSCREGLLQLEIADDGRGIDAETLENNSNFGIQGMRERVAAGGGDFLISSQPGSGLEISVSFPVNKKERIET